MNAGEAEVVELAGVEVQHVRRLRMRLTLDELFHASWQGRVVVNEPFNVGPEISSQDWDSAERRRAV